MAEKITYEQAVLAWELLEAGTGWNLIGRSANISQGTIQRVRDIFELAKQRDLNALDAIIGYDHIKAYAKSYFGVVRAEQEKEPAKPEDTYPSKEDIYKVLCGISYGITQLNKKMEKLCEAWEVKTDA